MRLGAILFVSIGLLELFTAALFLPVFYSVKSITTGLAHDLEQSKLQSPEQNKTTTEEVKTIRNDLDLLRPGVKTSDTIPSALLEQIIKVKPRGITVNNISYARVGELINIQLSGIAAHRDDILVYKNELGKDPLFEKPKSGDYIIKKTNISFSIMLIMK